MKKICALLLLVFGGGLSSITFTAGQYVVMAPEHATQVRAWHAVWQHALNHNVMHEQKLQPVDLASRIEKHSNRFDVKNRRLPYPLSQAIDEAIYNSPPGMSYLKHQTNLILKISS